MEYNERIPIGLQKPTDYNFAVLLCPDEEDLKDEERLLEDKDIWRKVNPHIGTIVQESFYEQQAEKAKTDTVARKEFFTKLLNIFQSKKEFDWVSGDDIRRLQEDVRVDDLRAEDGWKCTIGFDLSGIGDDLYAMSILAFNVKNGYFFADMEAWVAEEVASNSSLWPLYQEWAAAGWLHIVPAAVFDNTLFLNRVAEIAEVIDIMGFGYDPYRSKQPVNDLSAWLYVRGIDPTKCVIPVRQNFQTFNPLVLEFDVMIHNNPPLLRFSKNPMWLWEFGNCMLAESSDGLCMKPVKGGTKTGKIDNVQALLNALHLFDYFDGKIS